ncbi:MAG: nuclear transport factor 2 family protein [Acidimicrobiales bacterium]
MATTTIEQELLTLEHRYWQAIKDGDVDTALSLTDDPCFVAGAQGVGRVDHAAYRQMMTENSSWEIIDFSIGDDAQVHVEGDTALVAYTVHEELTVDGDPVTFDAADTSTWIRRDGKWVCSLHTESILGDPYGRDRKKAKAKKPS